MAIRKANPSEVLEVIKAAIDRGARMPTAQELGLVFEGQTGRIARALKELTRLGCIRVEIYPHNYRVVTILKGEYAGRCTVIGEENMNRKPYRVLEGNRDCWVGREGRV